LKCVKLFLFYVSYVIQQYLRLYQSNAVVLSFCVELSHTELVKGIRLFTMKYTKEIFLWSKVVSSLSYVCIYICMCVCVCMCVYTYTHTLTLARVQKNLGGHFCNVPTPLHFLHFIIWIKLHNFSSLRHVYLFVTQMTLSQNTFALIIFEFSFTYCFVISRARILQACRKHRNLVYI